MELIASVFGVIVLVLAYALWVWWKDGRTWLPFSHRVRRRLQSALGVVSRDEMRELEVYVQDRQQEWEARVTKLEATAKFSNQLQYVSKEIERRLTQLELSEGPNMPSQAVGVQHPRSLVRLGVRLTLSDALWAHLGAESVDEMGDHLIDSLVQGPFCPVCLKWLVGRGQDRKSDTVLEPCRHCGVSWDCQGAVDHPISSIDLKRRVYEQLDLEYRAGGTLY